MATGNNAALTLLCALAGGSVWVNPACDEGSGKVCLS